jgi:hypothetical protein
MPVHDWTRIDPNLYHDFHGSWYVAIRNTLNGGLLPAGYYALSEQTTPPVIPDVLTLQAPGSDEKPSTTPGGGVATLPRATIALSGVNLKPPKRSRRWLAIRHSTDHKLVAVIEVVSPSNKAKLRSYDQFINKSVALLHAGVHLAVLDLFPPNSRGGRRIHPSIWRRLVREKSTRGSDRPLVMASYCAEGNGAFRAFVEPVAVGDKLPNLPLFLTPRKHVSLPLEQTYRAAWAGFPEFWKKVLEAKPTKK